MPPTPFFTRDPRIYNAFLGAVAFPYMVAAKNGMVNFYDIGPQMVLLMNLHGAGIGWALTNSYESLKHQEAEKK
jgi:hypothetical protein